MTNKVDALKFGHKIMAYIEQAAKDQESLASSSALSFVRTAEEKYKYATNEHLACADRFRRMAKDILRIYQEEERGE